MKSSLLEYLAKRIFRIRKTYPLRVGIDGVDGAGKTIFADHLSETIAGFGRPVIRSTVDGFHNPRSIRYRRGKDSPEGFFEDSYNYDRLKALLLDPLGPDGSRHIRAAIFDHRTDSTVESPIIEVPDDAILIFDGIFLQRPELEGYWDLIIFLEADFHTTVPRMAGRDGGDPDPLGERNRRYVEGQKIYLEGCKPREKADIVVDNNDFANPQIIRL